MKPIFLIILCILFCRYESNGQALQKMELNHVAIYVLNLQKSAQFYQGVLGLDSIPEPFHDGKHLWLDVGGGRQIHIIQGAKKKKEYFQNNHICLSTIDVVGFTKLLEEKKIEWVDARGNPYKITTRVDGVEQVFLKDPDGYWIEVNNSK